MNIYLFIEITLGSLTIFGMVFGVFIYINKPAITSDKNDALMSQSISQLQTDLTNLRDNHVHTLDTKLDQTIMNVAQMAIQLAQLSTIIDERIPKNKL